MLALPDEPGRVQTLARRFGQRGTLPWLYINPLSHENQMVKGLRGLRVSYCLRLDRIVAIPLGVLDA